MSPDDPRFTAYALGEPLEPTARTEIEAALAADATLRAELRELRAFTGLLREAVRPPQTVVARPLLRVLPFRDEAESAPWRRQLLRMAAVFFVSASAIGLASWWTAQRVTDMPVPEPALTHLEIELGSPAGTADLAPEHARIVRASVGESWAQLAAALQAGRLPSAGAVPGRQELLGLLPMVESGGPEQVRVAGAAVPGDDRSAWLAVTIPAGLAVGRSVSVETRRMDEVTVRELASGFGPAGERVLLFGLTSRARAPEVRVQLPGTAGATLAAAQLWQDFRHAPVTLRQAVALAVVGEALRGTPAQARLAMREALKIVEAAGEAGEAVAVVGRRAAQLLEAENGA